MHIYPANPTSHARRATLVVCVALLAGSCGGGGIPPPVAEPPVFTTPTAVRVTQATPFTAGCLPLPAGAIEYTNAEVEPHLAIDPAAQKTTVPAWTAVAEERVARHLAIIRAKRGERWREQRESEPSPRLLK